MGNSQLGQSWRNGKRSELVVGIWFSPQTGRISLGGDSEKAVLPCVNMFICANVTSAFPQKRDSSCPFGHCGQKCALLNT